MKMAIPLDDIESANDTSNREANWQLCSKLASEANILQQLALAVRANGMVGKIETARLLFLALVSRFFKRPISVAVKGPSSGGKSFW